MQLILLVALAALGAVSTRACNDIRSLELYKQCGKNCTELDLVDKDLCPLDETVFVNQPALNLLNMIRSNLSALPVKLFAQNVNLISLYLNFNNLQELPSGIFSPTTKLQALFLSSNQLTALPRNVFDNTNLYPGGILRMDGNILQCSKAANLSDSCSCTQGVFYVNETRVWCNVSETTSTTTSSTSSTTTTTTTTHSKTTKTTTESIPDLSTAFSSTSTSPAYPMDYSEPRNAKTVAIVSGVVAGSIALSLLALIAYTRATGGSQFEGPLPQVVNRPRPGRQYAYRELPSFSDVDDIEMEDGSGGEGQEQH